MVELSSSKVLGCVVMMEQREAREQLKQVNDAGKRFTAEFHEGERTMHVLAGKIQEKDIEAAGLRAHIEELEAPGEGFASNDPLPTSVTIKINSLRQQLTDIIETRKHLKAVEGQTRLRLIKVAKSIEELEFARKNLEALAKGEDPASGPVGGIYRVTV